MLLKSKIVDLLFFYFSFLIQISLIFYSNFSISFLFLFLDLVKEKQDNIINDCHNNYSNMIRYDNYHRLVTAIVTTSCDTSKE